MTPPCRPGGKWSLQTLGSGLFLLLSAYFLIFYALGQKALAGSEDRWAEIARNMLLHGDLFHPVINGEIYFDKPLLSYWLIVLASLCTNGLSEFTVRLPGALAALLALFCSHRIARDLFDARVAWLSACLIATSYGFLFWSHTASAEISNLALIAAAAAWFVHRRDRADFSSYLIFYLLCAVGCQLKGLTAIVVPLLVVAPYVLRGGRWRPHVNVVHLLAILPAAGIFLLPYLFAGWQPLPAAVEAQRNQLSGFDLLIRENVVRFFRPFDHDDPFYSYLYELPRILFPWMFLFVAALARYALRYRQLGESLRWLLEAIVLIFLFFTLSGSRRWYYILPIMPLCMILVAAYMNEASRDEWLRRAMIATVFVLLVTALLLLLFPVVVTVYAVDVATPNEFLIGSAVIAAGGAGIALLGRNRMAVLRKLTNIDSSFPSLLPLALLLAVLEMAVVFGLVLPGADSYRQQKPFALSLAGQIGGDQRLAFYRKKSTTLAFYLNAKKAIPTINTRSELAAIGDEVVVMLEEADREAFFQEFPELRTMSPLLQEKSTTSRLAGGSSGFIAYRARWATALPGGPESSR